MRREPDFERLEPEKMRLFRTGNGALRLTVDGDRSYLEVKVVRAFPFSQSEHYITLLDARDRDMVIGMVREPGALEAESRQALEGALGRHYFLPTITRVHSLKEEFGTMYFDVETDRGPRKFVARGLRDGMDELDDGQVIIPDVDGNRCRIADVRELDTRSRRLLERVI